MKTNLIAVGAVALLAGCQGDRLAAERAELVKRIGPVIYDTDGCDMVYYRKGAPITEEDFYARRLNSCLGTSVDTIVYCPLSSGFCFMTTRKAGDFMNRSFPNPNSYNAAQEFADRLGTDALEMATRFARRNGKNILVSIRVNDTHDGSHSKAHPHPFFPPFKEKHPECLVGKIEGPERKGQTPWTTVDFAQPLVREHFAKTFRELCENYDIDGVLLDFNRHAHFFRSTFRHGDATDADIACMNGLMRELRRIADRVGRTRGRPILLAARTNDSIAHNRATGIDPEQWMKEKLLDFWVASGYFQQEPWTATAALAHKYGVKVFASLDESRTEEPAVRTKKPVIPGRSRWADDHAVPFYTARMSAAMFAGMDGIYHFNLENSPLEAVAKVHPQRTDGLDKLYFATERDPYDANYHLNNGARFDRMPVIFPLRPRKMAKGETYSFGILVGDDFAAAKAAGKVPHPMVRMIATSGGRVAEAAVRMNGRPLGPGRIEGLERRFALAEADVRRGTNEFEIEAKEPLDCNDFLLEVSYRPADAAEPGTALLDEKWADGWTRNWTVSNLNDIVTLTAKDGVLRLENAGAPKEKGASFLTIRSDLVAVTPGQDFAVLMESRGNLDMLMPVTTFRAKENQIRAFLPATAVLWYDADRKPLLAVDASGAILPTGSSFGFADMSDDFALTRHFGTVPKGAAFAAVQVGGKYPSFSPGKWLELRRLALKVREGADWDFGDIRPPAFERVSPSPDPNPNAPFVFTVTDESPIAQLTVKLDGVDVTGKMKAEGEGERRTFTVSHAPWADESLHLLEVSAKDAAGNIARETLAQYCGPRRKGKQLSVRDDGMILVGGKPFFPIGTSGARLAPPNGNDPERLFAEFASNGLNCVQGSYAYRTPAECYHDGGKGHQGPRPIAEMEAFHAAARRHGILLRTEPASRDYGTAKRTKEFVEALRYYRDKPEMVFYEVSDDTASHVTPDILRNDYNICRAIDNLALVTQSDANDYAGRYAPYAPATDVFLQELYPFRNAEHEPNGLAQIIRDCDFAFDGLRVSGMRNRSIWSIPQAFAGWGLWKKYPSRELVRVQTYLAIICGCRGISYYTYWSYSPGADGWGHDPKHTEELYSVTRELASIADDLTSRDAKVQPKVEIVAGTAKDPGGYSSVSCLLKDGADGKGPLLIAASSLVYGDPVTVRIPLEAGKVETVFENGRKVDFGSGVLTDTFASGEVHVYRLK